MLKVLLKSKILGSVILVSLIIISTLFFFIPKITEKNTIDLVTKNSINAVQQIKLTRAYYVSSVVKDVKKYAPNLGFDYYHKGADGKLPFPTTTIHDLSKIFSDNTGLTFNLYSDFPFKPKANRVLTSKQKEILKFTQENEDGIYVGRDTIDGKPVLRVAITDFMTDPSCVSCHNDHKDKTWETGKWQMGDRRGVLEVITPLDEPLLANNYMRLQILLFITVILVLLVIYFSFMLIRRESELLGENDILDAKIKEEVAKNVQKEKQLIIQNRSAALGDMLGAIVHQWKQPLNGISISNSAMKLQLELGDLEIKYFNTHISNIDQQIKNMNSTMDDFRDFFKPKKQSCYDVNTSINDVLSLIHKIYEIKNINIKLNLEDGLETNGYPNELNQVIINILNNARDAILGNNSDIKNIYIDTYKDENNFNIISIKDCAGGIPEDIIDKIFDPYVTTKSDKEGTGIGLDMSKAIMEKVDGDITASNVETTIDGKTHKGANFIITLCSC
ncbi:MAG: DUF3365 domain-containing protein [Arcobacteraceae bacterium]|nr:DUF3365 domain-containing protein [Arcobacteraceae bacterium]